MEGYLKIQIEKINNYVRNTKKNVHNLLIN